jgi:hypothetical protein
MFGHVHRNGGDHIVRTWNGFCYHECTLCACGQHNNNGNESSEETRLESHTRSSDLHHLCFLFVLYHRHIQLLGLCSWYACIVRLLLGSDVGNVLFIAPAYNRTNEELQFQHVKVPVSIRILAKAAAPPTEIELSTVLTYVNEQRETCLHFGS